jgi:L,D-peptidoglycan transpeptidase YkuD (ErfK/YbiS/YcfS/YnhG family)
MSTARLFADGRLVLGRLVCRAALGRAGLVAHKQEGDGGTPIAVLKLRRVLYRADRVGRPGCAVPVEPIAPQDGWCDDPHHRDYNRMVRLPHQGRHEELWRRDGIYDLIGVLGWNDAPVVRGDGSAIFLHVARPDFAPTQGCIALTMEDLAAVLAAGLDAIACGLD